MEDINYDYNAHERGFNQGFEMLELAPDIYESIIHITNAPKAYIDGLKDARKEYEKWNDKQKDKLTKGIEPDM